MSSRRRSLRALAAWGVGAATALAVGVALACGPFLEPRLLLQSDAVVVAAPRLVFQKEVERLKPSGPPAFAGPAPAGDPRGQTRGADLGDLRVALDRAGVGVPTRDGLLAGYTEARRRLAEVEAKTATDAGPVPVGLPAEFADYLRGAMAYHAGRPDEARQAWQAVLARAPDERQWRSTWAAFMLGRSLLETDAGEAVGWFRRVRELKDRAPQEADRFYKALVRRCGRTPLGREADRLRWFPAADPTDGAKPES
jgi:hypothetical protein